MADRADSQPDTDALKLSDCICGGGAVVEKLGGSNVWYVRCSECQQCDVGRSTRDQAVSKWNEAMTHLQMGYKTVYVPPRSTAPLPDPVNAKLVAAVTALKDRLECVPPSFLPAVAAAMSHGADKYGPYQWRDTSVTAGVYYAAALRHLLAWYSGETFDFDSRASHLAHAAASLAILIDATHLGILDDDRPVYTPF